MFSGFIRLKLIKKWAQHSGNLHLKGESAYVFLANSKRVHTSLILMYEYYLYTIILDTIRVLFTIL